MTSKANTIVIIDDDQKICEVLTHMITMCSEHQVFCAFNGKKGFSLVSKLKPDIVILDINMPGINGLEVLEKIKEQAGTRFVPVIMLTGDDSQANKMKSNYWFADAFLTKPCTRERLLQAINSILSYRNAARARDEYRMGLAS